LPEGPVVGAEVGVQLGRNAFRLLQRPDLTLHLIDIELKPAVVESLQSCAGERAIPWRYASPHIAKKFKNESLDFVFIDAGHAREEVTADIEAWMPKVKRGGLLCGHDYIKGRVGHGVKEVVDSLFSDRLDTDDDETWFVRV